MKEEDTTDIERESTDKESTFSENGMKKHKKKILRMALENIDFDDSDDEPEPPPNRRRVRFA